MSSRSTRGRGRGTCRAASVRYGSTRRWSPVVRTVLLVEELAVDAVRIALERERMVARVRKQHRCDARVVIDDLRLRESDVGVKDLVEVGELHRTALDLDLDGSLFSHLPARPP